MKKTTAKNKNIFRIGAVLLLTAFWVMIPFILNDKVVNADELSDTRIQASLSGAPINGVTPAGFSEWRLDDQGRRRLKVEATSVNLAAGTVLEIFINNNLAGQMSVNSFGGAFLDIDTNNGQNVPVVNFGNPIQVRQANGIILSGTFGTVTPTPSPSGSPNGSPSPSASPTGSPNASPSPTGSPNASPSPSPTGSPNGTPSPSPTGSPNATPSPTVSPTASPTGSPSPSPTASPNGTPSPSPTGSPSPSPSPNGGNLFAGLTGGTINGVLPNGFAQYELHSSRRELEVRVNQVNLPGGTPLTVLVDNAAVGQMFVSSGEARLRLRTDEGQNVPFVVNGSTIFIQNNGATILAGTFSGFASPSPSPSPSASPTGSPNGTPNPSPSPSPSASPSLGRYFETHPSGGQIDPPVTTNANGEFKVFLNQTETQATITGEFHNLSSAQTNARIEAQIGSNSVIHNFGTIGGTNGNFAAVTINVTPTQVQQLRAGLWFAVIASASNPNGEIGGKLIRQSSSADFDGDGSNDLSVFRPSTATWYALNSEGFLAQSFGSSTDVPVSADYDGDGKSDKAVMKNVNGNAVWEIHRSSDGGITSTQFGFATDKPVLGDFDGDGLNDIAVFRPSNGVWYVQKSNNTGFQIVQFGQNGDIPLSTDMDGDGKGDVTVFRPSTGVWYWIRSSNGAIGIVQFGSNGDKPAQGDFDGDGRDDIAVYRPSTGVWYIWRSVDGTFDIRQFGLSEDIPVAGNYDGDNKTDIAVFRPSTGDWYIWRSVDGTYEFRHFGLTGDIPTIAR